MGRVAAFRPVKRTSSDRGGRFYETPDGRYPSVTNILQCVGKPALITWAANKEREYVLEAAAALYEDCPAAPKMSRLAFITSLKNRLTKEKAGDRIKQRAADIGSAVHAMIEWQLRKELGQTGAEPSLPSSEAAFAFAQWEQWRSLVALEPMWTEHTVWSSIYQYAGTLDFTGTIQIPTDRELVKKAFVLPNDTSLEAFYQKHKGERVTVVADLKTSKRVYLEAFFQVAAYGAALQEMGHGRHDLGLIIRLPKTAEDPGFEAVPILDMDKEFAHFLHIMETWRRQREYDIASGWVKEA